MNDIYIADDGTIRSRNATPAPSTGASRPASYQSRYRVSTGRKVWFWVFSILSALAVGSFLTDLCGPIDLGEGAFIDFFERILPFGLVVGALLGSILYGCIGAGNLSYNLGAFILSFLCAIAGTIGVGAVICVAPFVLIGIWYVFVAVLVIGIIVGLCSGGN